MNDLINAGAIWGVAPLVVDRHFVSSRRPDDLPDFCNGIFQAMESNPSDGQSSAVGREAKTSKRPRAVRGQHRR